MKASLFQRQPAYAFGHHAFKMFILAIPLLLILGVLASGVAGRSAQARRLEEPTQQTPVVCTQTLAVTEGPFYRAGSPERTNLVETGMVGARVSVVGYVYDTNCQP